MLSHSQQSLLRKLSARKYRWQNKQFIAEGRTLVKDLLASGLKPHFLLAQEGTSWSEKEAVLVSEKELQAWSKLEKSDEVLGIFPFPEFSIQDTPELVVILDQVRDPGNLGTIIRTCDWFNVTQVYCTNGCTDVYNSKAIQGSMGSITRVEARYDSSENIYKALRSTHRMVCAHMKGIRMDEFDSALPMALILGSESHGPSDFWLEKSELITIPAYGKNGAESLNVAIANAILLSFLRLG